MAIAQAECVSRMCNTDGQNFCSFVLIYWIGDSWFTSNDPTGIYDAEPINKSIEAENGSMRATIKHKKDTIIKLVDGQMTSHTLEHIKYCNQASHYHERSGHGSNKWKL